MFKKFITNPIVIIIAIILTLGILAIVGYYQWDWFRPTEQTRVSNIRNFPDISPGVFIPLNEDQTGRLGYVAQPVSLYKICISKSFILPQNVDPIKAQEFIDQLKSEFQYIATTGLKILLSVNIVPNIIAPNTVVTFTLYAMDCNNPQVKKAVDYINNLH